MSSEGGVVTGTMLRDLVLCERRAFHDVHTPDELRAPTSSFVELLWAGGVSHEGRVLEGLDGVRDLRGEPPAMRRRATVAALAASDAAHIVGAEIAIGGLVGRPDLISRIDGRWTPGDVKAGTPFMPDGRRVKDAYGVQIGLYGLIMAELGHGDGGTAFVIGADGERVVFDLDAPWSRSTVRRMTTAAVERAREIQAGVALTRGEASAKCGLCHWRNVCKGELERADDLTLIAEIGRKARADIEAVAPSRLDLAHVDLDAIATAAGGSGVPDVGADRLRRFQDRARLQLTPDAGAYAREPLGLSRAPVEWHLDIEADPTRHGFVYLHGIWERVATPERTESRFVHFFADGPDGEREAFAATWAFLNSDPTARVYYYSRYERTAYRTLQRRYPEVCTAEDVEAFFADPRVVDLYTDVVRPKTEWPLSSYGTKPLAKSLGFFWRAEDAGGASSIAWYDEYARTGDDAVREKIVDYNRSDCQASAVVLDALIGLPVGVPSWRPVADGSDRDDDAGSEPTPVADRLPAADDEASHDRDGGSLPVLRAATANAERRLRAALAGDPVAEARRPSAPGTPAPSTARLYATPALTPCRRPIPDGASDEVHRDYAALGNDLPLLGAEAMRPVVHGGVVLCARLRDELPWMKDAIDVIERQLRVAVWAGRPWLQWGPLCLEGDAGVGKSHLAREIGRIAGVPSAQLDMGGMHDAAALVPTARGWSNTKPCWPAAMMSALGCANPVLTLDELEKSGGSKRNGDPQQALLAMIEPSTAAAYFDTCLMTPVDLSGVCWVATVNDADLLPRPLRSRLDVVRVPAPAVEHFDVIAAVLLRSTAARWGVPVASIPELPRRARSVLREAFARHRSVRLLRRHLGDVLSALIPAVRRDAN